MTLPFTYRSALHRLVPNSDRRISERESVFLLFCAKHLSIVTLWLAQATYLPPGRGPRSQGPRQFRSSSWRSVPPDAPRRYGDRLPCFNALKFPTGAPMETSIRM